MKFSELIPAEFVWRANRFMASVRVAGEPAYAHIANSGRLPGLLNPGDRIWLVPAKNPNRKTRYDLKLVEREGILISIDARLPNYLFQEAVLLEQLPDFDYPNIKLEVKMGHSRLDARLDGPPGTCWVETKSVTLVENRVARFPDAPTSRGRKHLAELMAVTQKGDRAAVVFIVQRPDADRFEPNTAIDPEFSAQLAQAAAAGVAVKAYGCSVTPAEIRIQTEMACDWF